MSTEKYLFLQCIGKGNFGDVYKAMNKSDNNVVAIKVINLDESTEDIKVLVQEIQFLSRLNSPYITRYFETFVRDYNMYIVMEYCGGQSCADLIKFYKTIPEEIVCYIIKDVLKGLSYLHLEGKVHRDIKLANILLNEAGEVKLADFGVSGQITLTQVKRNTFVGTPYWMAPEVITKARNKEAGGYDERADIWSAGITTIELVTGSPPLAQHDPMKIIFEIPKKRPPTLNGVNFSENIKDFVKYCLVKDPTKRPSANTLLRHHFITAMRSSHTVKNKLISMIKQKNIVLGEKNKLLRKPRFCLEGEIVEEVHNWDFSTISTKGLQRGEVLFYCLEQVYTRGRNQDTKEAVHALINSLAKYEKDQPGICEAIVEEVLHFK